MIDIFIEMIYIYIYIHMYIHVSKIMGMDPVLLK